MARLDPVPVRRGALVAAIVVAAPLRGWDRANRPIPCPRHLARVPSDQAQEQQAYSPIGEGFESPLDPRENLKGPCLMWMDARRFCNR